MPQPYLGPERRKAQRRQSSTNNGEYLDRRGYKERRQDATAIIVAGLSAEGMLALRDTFRLLASLDTAQSRLQHRMTYDEIIAREA